MYRVGFSNSCAKVILFFGNANVLNVVCRILDFFGVATAEGFILIEIFIGCGPGAALLSSAPLRFAKG